MKLPLVGPSYETDDRSYDAQRCVNLIPEVSESGTSKEQSRLIGSPGLEFFATLGSGPIRGEIVTASGRCFKVSGEDFYEVEADGTTTNHGQLNTVNGRVSIAENGSQVMVVDGTNGYIFTLSGDTWAQIADAQFPNGATICLFVDTYFLANDPGTGDFYASDNNDGTSWTATDKTTVESAPDNLVSMAYDSGELVLFGTYTTEFFHNVSAQDPTSFPFKRISGAVINVGCAAAHTVKNFDNNIVWVAQAKDGGPFVARLNSANKHEKISPRWLDKLLEGVDDISTAYALVYKQDGHEYYVLQVEGLFTTPVFDAATQRWHERMFFNPDIVREERHLMASHSYFAGFHLIGDRISGKVYKLKTDVYTDNGDEIHRIRVIPHMHNEEERVKISEAKLGMQTGVGGETEPLVMLSISDNGGNTYGNERTRGFGKQGEYGKLVRWKNLGQKRSWTFKVRITDAVKVSLYGFYVK